jgi:hypothetical protein
MGGFRLRTEPTASFFRKTQPPSSPILEKNFWPLKTVSAGSTRTTPLLSLETTHVKKQTQTTKPNQKMKKDYPQTILGTSQRAQIIIKPRRALSLFEFALAKKQCCPCGVDAAYLIVH